MEVLPSFIFSLFATLVAVALIVWPHWNPDLGSDSEQSNAGARPERDRLERLAQILADLELDLQTGKLSEDEYSDMRARTQSEFEQVRAAMQE